MDNANEFAALGQGFSTAVTSFSDTLYYEESPTGSGLNETVLVGGARVYCPSCHLMNPQVVHDGIARGSRVTWGRHPTTVLSVYRAQGVDRVQACIMLDDRRGFFDRQGLPVDELTLIPA